MLSPRLCAAWPYLLYAAIVAWYCAPLFASPNGLGLQDWDQHLFYYGSVLKSVFEYGQLPFWNPWYCGGNVLWQNPQVPLLSPVFPLALVVSLPLAMKINIALHYWIGLVGMHVLLTSSLGVRSRVVSMAVAVIAVCSGGMAMHLAVGHSVFLPVLYLPFQLHFVIRGVRSGAVRDAAFAAIPLALMVYNGALHAAPMSVAGIGVFCVCASVAQRRIRPVAVGLLIGVLAFAFAAPKLVPIGMFVNSAQFLDARPTIEHPDAMSREMLTRTYLDRYQYRNLQLDGQRSGWFEYGNYIGGVGASVILAGLALALFVPATRDRWLGLSLAAAALACLVLSAGEFGALAPASLARSLPLFSSFRIPSRYTLAFVVFGAAAAGWAWTAASLNLTANRAASVLVLAIGSVAMLDVVSQNRVQFEGVFSLPPLERGFTLGRLSTVAPVVERAGDPYGPNSPMLHALVNDVDFYNCYEPLQLVRNADADRPLVIADDKSRIFQTRFTPNRVDVSVTNGREPSEIRLNQNAAPGWSSSSGPVTPDGAPGMRTLVQPGHAGTLTFRYVPPGLYLGSVIGLIGLVVSLLGRHRQITAR